MTGVTVTTLMMKKTYKSSESGRGSQCVTRSSQDMTSANSIHFQRLSQVPDVDCDESLSSRLIQRAHSETREIITPDIDYDMGNFALNENTDLAWSNIKVHYGQDNTMLSDETAHMSASPINHVDNPESKHMDTNLCGETQRCNTSDFNYMYDTESIQKTSEARGNKMCVCIEVPKIVLTQESERHCCSSARDSCPKKDSPTTEDSSRNLKSHIASNIVMFPALKRDGLNTERKTLSVDSKKYGLNADVADQDGVFLDTDYTIGNHRTQRRTRISSNTSNQSNISNQSNDSLLNKSPKSPMYRITKQFTTSSNKKTTKSKFDRKLSSENLRSAGIVTQTLKKLRQFPVPNLNLLGKLATRSPTPPITPVTQSDTLDYGACDFDHEVFLGNADPKVFTFEISNNKAESRRVKKPSLGRLFSKDLEDAPLPLECGQSRSAESLQEIPLHAQFLQYGKRPRRPVRRSLAAMNRTAYGDSDSDSDSAYPNHHSGAPAKSKKKTLAQGMKDKLAFLRRRQGGKDGLQRPPPDVALSWSKGFNNLLNDKYGLELFREFLRTEFSEENIEFWIACEDYKNSQPNSQLNTAQLIYTDFVAVQSPREVNLDSKTRLLTLDNMQSPDKDTFDAAQKRIQNLMEKDSYPRFLNSEVYQEMLGEHRHKLKLRNETS